MRVTVQARSFLPVEALFAWWTDFGPEGSVQRVEHGIGHSDRRVVSRRPSHVVLEEAWPLPLDGRIPLLRHEVWIDQEKRTMHETASGHFAFEARWSFTSLPDGGSLVERAVVADAGVARFAPASVARKALQRDLDAHVRQAEAELGRAATPT